MVYVTGDIHGWLDIGKLTPSRWPQGQRLRHSDFLVICGDFGLLWSNPPTLEEKFFLDWLDGCPWTTLFVDGNHENYDLLDALPTSRWHGGLVGRIAGYPNVIHLMRGQVYEMGRDGRWFVMGGAPSHDRQWREEGISWWPREMPSGEEYAEALANLDRVGWQVDYVFTHEVPRSLRRHAMSRNFDPSREEDDKLTAFLQKVDERLCAGSLKLWYAGHYHDDLVLRDSRHAELYQQIVPLGGLPDGSVHRHVPFCGDVWQSVGDKGRVYREWILSRKIEGCSIAWQDNEHLRVTTDGMFGEVVFHPFDDGSEVVELVATRLSEGEPAFHTRFVLAELLRAKELFLEMCGMMVDMEERGATQVLLCCQAGVSTAAFEEELRQKTAKLSLKLAFSAMPLDDALASGLRPHIVLVAPQVGYRRHDVVRAFPHATVVETPPELFAALDARATLRLLLDVLNEGMRGERVGRDLRIARPVDDTKNVMVVSVVHHRGATVIGYRVFAQAGVLLDGVVRKRHVDEHDIDDVLACVALDGVRVSDLDAVGITLPGTVNGATVSLPSDDMSDYDLGRRLEKRYGVEVYVDNVANAAAVGCYVTQTDYDSVVFHLQETGSKACDEGLVVDGHLVKGRLNRAGELLPLLSRMRLSADAAELVWTYEGMREVVAAYLLAPLCVLSPDAVYVSSALVGDAQALRQAVVRTVGEVRVPPIELVRDYRELAYLGELALCIHKLAHPRPHRKW